MVAKRTYTIIILAIVGLLLVGGSGRLFSGQGLPPAPFESPQTLSAAPQTNNTYVPVWYVPGTKFGVAGRDCTGQEAIGASWFYAWSPYAPPCPGRPWDGVPMIWGDIYGPSLPLIESNSPYLLGPNECDRHDQCNLTVEKLVLFLHRIYAQYTQYKHTSPAPSNWAVAWLVLVRDEYIRVYGEPPPWQVLAVHCYDSAAACIRQLTEYKALAAEWGIQQIWLTEYSATPEMNVEWQQEIHDLTAWIEDDPIVTRYAIYVSHQDCGDGTWNCVKGGNPQLFDIGGGLTLIGREYLLPTPETGQ